MSGCHPHHFKLRLNVTRGNKGEHVRDKKIHELLIYINRPSSESNQCGYNLFLLKKNILTRMVVDTENWINIEKKKKWAPGSLQQTSRACKRWINILDSAGDMGSLVDTDRALRCELREQVKKLSELEEIKWRQLSCIKRVNKGDGNTMFLHSYANGRRQHNWIHSIQDVMHDTVNSMAALLRDHFIYTLGTAFALAAYINFSSLHSKVDLNLAPFDSHLPEEDILAAINSFEEIMPQAQMVFLWLSIKNFGLSSSEISFVGSMTSIPAWVISNVLMIAGSYRSGERLPTRQTIGMHSCCWKIFSKVLACRLQLLLVTLSVSIKPLLREIGASWTISSVYTGWSTNAITCTLRPSFLNSTSQRPLTISAGAPSWAS